MHLEGYGCAGASATAYGSCRELEAGDSAAAQFRLGARVACDVSDPRLRIGGAEADLVAAMARGEAIGCFGLTEWDFGSDPAGMRTTARRSGSDYVLNGSKAWITNGGIADVAVVWARTDPRMAGASGAIRGFVVPTDTQRLSRTQHRAQAFSAGLGDVGVDFRRLPVAAEMPCCPGSAACAGRSAV
jgi:glutaryl-CoA dehydrogenase